MYLSTIIFGMLNKWNLYQKCCNVLLPFFFFLFFLQRVSLLFCSSLSPGPFPQIKYFWSFCKTVCFTPPFSPSRPTSCTPTSSAWIHIWRMKSLSGLILISCFLQHEDMLFQGLALAHWKECTTINKLRLNK